MEYTSFCHISLEMARNLMLFLKQKKSEEQHIGRQLKKENDIVLDVLDFAGQGAYYATHQTYMRKDAIYIIVFDVSRDLDNAKYGEHAGESNICDRAFSSWTQKGECILSYSKVTLILCC
jgi:GTPase SAR1 family protein